MNLTNFIKIITVLFKLKPPPERLQLKITGVFSLYVYAFLKQHQLNYYYQDRLHK